jgi:hypothetical protein
VNAKRTVGRRPTTRRRALESLPAADFDPDDDRANRD